MGILQKLNDKRILIWGYGREGKSTEAFLREYCPDSRVTVFEGKREDFDIDDYDYVIKSPGIPCFEEDERLTSQTQLFMEQFWDRTIGITGTKGKSTTASLLYHVLKKCGVDAVLVGNIGLPCLDHYDELMENRDKKVVFELSCHQLSTMRTSPATAVILNLYEEHLDYYKTADRYFAAKLNIARYQDDRDDYLIIGDNAAQMSTFLKERADRIVDFDGDYDYDLKLHGRHNQFNAEFVRCICMDMGFINDESAIRSAMADFEGLPHRLEYVGEYDGIGFYDDSISTIPEAAISAAGAVKGVQTLLIGGMDRGIDYDKLIDFIKSSGELLFICMYASGQRIYEEGHFEGADNVFYVPDLEAAVELAFEITEEGRNCILSPASASYDHFKNFEERGDKFKELVAELGKETDTSDPEDDFEGDPEYLCPCCGHRTLSEKGGYEICPVCCWEDDPVQSKDPDLAGGANKPSLNEARENYERFGACEERFLDKVRKPLLGE